MIPCLGGFCLSRTRCAHYYAESTHEPCERLCGAVEEPELGTHQQMVHEARDRNHSQVHGRGNPQIHPMGGRQDGRDIR